MQIGEQWCEAGSKLTAYIIFIIFSPAVKAILQSMLDKGPNAPVSVNQMRKPYS